MILPETVAKKIITKLIAGEDYRIEVLTLINAYFLQYAIDFFKRVVEAKLNSKDITVDWYKKEFLNTSLTSKEIAINSGLNMKTISNMYNTGRRDVVINASNIHYEELSRAIEELVQADNSINIMLTVKLNGVSVDLNINESLIVINTLAVKRSELRGGLWSTAGKRVEKPLMLTLCKLFGVSDTNYETKIGHAKVDALIGFEREVDFYLVNPLGKEYKCEVKLMGKGNPESADAVIARDSQVFIADKLSITNKRQLNSLHVFWVEMRDKNGFRKFSEVLSKLDIPHQELNTSTDIKEQLNNVFGEIFK